MKIFPKKISQETWREHLYQYSRTLVHYADEVFNLLSAEHRDVTIFDVYLCPLCLKNYFVNGRNGLLGNAEFSHDHVPPSSVGGRHKLLTCKRCNNNSGSVEAELEKLLNFAVNKKNPSELLIPNVSVVDPLTGDYIKGYAKHNQNGTEILFNENVKQFNPKYVEFLSDLKNKKRLKLDIKLFDQEKIEKALLKSAYLICFIWWGYEFAFSSNGNLLRKAIKGEIKYPLRVPISWVDGKENFQTEICLLECQSKRLAFAVNITLKGIDVKTTACVIIPKPTDQGWDELKQVSQILGTEPQEVIFRPLPIIRHRIGYTVSWNIVLNTE